MVAAAASGNPDKSGNYVWNSGILIAYSIFVNMNY